MKTPSQRQFAGPFLMLGITPTWPAELDKRKQNGHLFQLSSLFPIRALQPGVIYDKDNNQHLEAAPAPAPVVVQKATNTQPTLIRVVEKQGPWAARVERMAIEVGDDTLVRLMQALDKPRTAKQVQRALHIARPTVDYYMRALQMAIGSALVISHRGRAKTFMVRHAGI
jgi:hypothetical protein